MSTHATASSVDSDRLNRFGAIRAIYFDLDDTLCGYWDAAKRGLRAAFVELGPPQLTTDEWVQAWAKTFREYSRTLKHDRDRYLTYCRTGEPSRTEQMRLTLLSVGMDDLALAEALSEAYMRLRDRNLHLFEESRMVLEALAPLYPLGLITNGPADIQRQEVATCGLDPLMQNIFIEGEMEVGKPNPSVFERAAAAVGFGPEELLFVGNSYGHDIEPAIAAGWATVWVRRASDVPPSWNGHKSLPEERPEGSPAPDLECDDLRAILPFLRLG